MSNQLLPPSFLFRFAAGCRATSAQWSSRGITLGEEYSLPDFAELDEAPHRVSVKAAWNEQGLLFSAAINGKKQAPWCRENRLEDSDGFYLWIDTRDTHNIHRASRFCHQFVFLPTGGGHRLDEPVAELLPINRARENPKPVRSGTLQSVHHKQSDGYQLDVFIPARSAHWLRPYRAPASGVPLGRFRPRNWRTHILLPARLALQRRSQHVGHIGVATMNIEQ